MDYPCFKTTNREGKKAVWVYFGPKMSDRQNIYDLNKKELTEGVKCAIRFAFEVGYEKCKEDMIDKINNSVYMKYNISTEFEEIDENF